MKPEIKERINAKGETIICKTKGGIITVTYDKYDEDSVYNKSIKCF